MRKAHVHALNGAKICGAKSKRTGKPCRQPAMTNGRCRLHGGKSTGRPITTGQWTKEAIAQREEIRELIRSTNEMFGNL